MIDAFTVERVAVHLVDRELPGPQFAEQEIDLASFTHPGDIDVLRGFFSGHLNELWTAKEGNRTCSAHFTELSDMRRYYEALAHDSSQFFSLSRDMAQRLYDVSHNRRATRGLLMVLWFRVAEEDQCRLALLKMDPGRSEKVTLSQGQAGEFLLDLVVRYIDHALPDPGGRVLKWAMTPHPSRPAFDMKVADKQGGADPTDYFMSFLGCKVGVNEKKQVRGLLEVLPAYAQEYHAQEDWKTQINEVVEELEREDQIITPEVVVEKIQTSNAFKGFQEEAFRDKLVRAQVGELNVSPSTLRTTRLQYKLPSGIVISGPRAAMESLITIVPFNGDVEIRIRTVRNYETNYVF